MRLVHGRDLRCGNGGDAERHGGHRSGHRRRASHGSGSPWRCSHCRGIGRSDTRNFGGRSARGGRPGLRSVGTCRSGAYAGTARIDRQRALERHWRRGCRLPPARISAGDDCREHTDFGAACSTPWIGGLSRLCRIRRQGRDRLVRIHGAARGGPCQSWFPGLPGHVRARCAVFTDKTGRKP